MKKFKDFIKEEHEPCFENWQKIEKLNILIQEYKEEQEKLEQMVENWENEDDPMSDPGLQYEQETRIESIYNKIKEFAKTL
jgi:hypothetical protein